MVCFGLSQMEREVYVNKKKIAVPIYSFGPGGAERVVSILLKEFNDIYDFTLILMNDNIFYEIPEDVEIIFLERSKPFEPGIFKLLKLPILALKLKEIAKQKEFDLILSFMNRPNYISVLAKLFGLDIPVIISERGTPSSFYDNGSMYGRVSRKLISMLYPKADIVTTNSYGAKEDLEDNFGVKNIEVIYNPYDIEQIKESMQRDVVQRDEDSKFVWISVGRVDRNKNHEAVVEAFDKIREDGDYLWIVGEGIDIDRLKELIRQFNIDDSVKLFGKRDNPFSIMVKADTFVTASKTEGFPNVLVEALACGLPVVSFDCKSGPREILANMRSYKEHIDSLYEAEYGILVPLNDIDSLAEGMRLMKRKEYNSKYRKKAFQRVRSFDKQYSLDKFKQLIERFV